MITLYICLLAALTCPVLSARPSGLHFVGIGYNILKGNPDGGVASRGGVDPGLLLTRRIFEISPGDSPVEVVYEPRYSCARIQTTSVFYGTKSYQKKLSLGVKSSGAANVVLASFAFSLSAGYASAHEETHAHRNVFQDDQKVCNLGRARFAEELAESEHFNISRGFASAICSLPLNYNQSAYMEFLNDWGTVINTISETNSYVTSVSLMRMSLELFTHYICARFSITCLYKHIQHDNQILCRNGF
ncbi:hypothetical protein CHS0354_042319 [Potamilus streckersoni]|uniref:MACPF domain-containing protein n=1 Tax=Potamilus streckersoni TaxID=2493646 RepID=A0AAE0STU1_9BIVA|nr:hypothetical protein CHS0354_042319 [Potamilus streckersoni]